MVSPFSMDPATIDENLRFFKSEIVPQIKAAPGFCSLRNMVNRKTDEGYVGTVGADRAALDKQAEGAAVARRDAARAGFPSVRSAIWSSSWSTLHRPQREGSTPQGSGQRCGLPSLRRQLNLVKFPRRHSSTLDHCNTRPNCADELDMTAHEAP